MHVAMAPESTFSPFTTEITCTEKWIHRCCVATREEIDHYFGDPDTEGSEHPEATEVGICMNCGAEMDYSPAHPWCPDCDEDEDGD